MKETIPVSVRAASKTSGVEERGRLRAARKGCSRERRNEAARLEGESQFRVESYKLRT